MSNPLVHALSVLLVAGCGGTISTSADTAVETVEDVAADPEADEAGEPEEDVEPDAPDTVDDCTELVWYLDADHDGFGTNETTHTGCEPPAGYVEVGGDCDDGNSIVHPGQYAYFTEPYGAGSFDYNCDGIEEAESLVVHHCGPLNCIDGRGWNEDFPPACGERGAWVSCEHWGPVCNYNPSWPTQGCR